MAQAATRQSSAARKRRTAHPTSSRSAASGSPSASRLPGSHLPTPQLSIWVRLARRILMKAGEHELRRLGKAANWRRRPQLPVQAAVDVAVPLHFAWSEWMRLRFLPEGVDRVVDIDRDGAGLRGHLAGGSDADRAWGADVLDERERESFAWRSTEGSDCAGLVTFHSLSERLTRLELTLDVYPRGASEAVQLLTHLAHRRAHRELRRFKAELELVSPDVYAGGERGSSD